MSASLDRPEAELTLDAFQGTPEPARDGLQAIAAAVSPGFSTTQAREDRSDDRVVSAATCSLCGQFHGESKVCPQREADGELGDDRVRAIGGGAR